MRWIITAAALLAVAAAAHAQDTPGEGQLIGPEGRAFPLKHTEVRAEVAGPVARVVVRQSFHNPFDEAIEALYVFPLPDRAAVDDFTMEMGTRRIRGEIRRREEARKDYEAAKKAGKTAALLTQERPDVFTQHLANILAGETIVVEIRYVEHLVYEDGGYTLVFPMTVGPRFHPPGAVADAERVPSQPGEYVKPPGRPGHEVTLTVAIDAGVPLHDVTSPSHRISVSESGVDGCTLNLAPSDRIPNKDFVLRWKVAGAAPQAALLTHRSGDEGYFTLIVQPEAQPVESVIVPREMFLVVDCSGSMSGMPLETAKEIVRQTLKTLDPWDTFQILRFSEHASGLAALPLPATPANVQKGLAYIDQLRGSGGTMMIEGIRAALSGERDPDRLRIVHFLTDGFIGNETQILDEVIRGLNGARIFPLGVGASPNRYLIDRLARVGRGAATFVEQGATPKRIAQEVARFVERVRQPTLVDLEIDWQGLPVKDVMPSAVPDLFVGQPVVVHGRFDRSAAGTIRIKGRRGGLPYDQAVAVVLPDREAAHDALPQLWARARIAELVLAQGQGLGCREEITALALQFRLMSAYTAFVAVEEQVVVEGGARKVVRQPLALPEGTEWDGFFADKPFDGTGTNHAIGLGGGGGGAYGGRRGGRRNLRAAGGGGRTQMAVETSLDWLVTHQSPDGRWDADGFAAQGDPSRGPLCDGAATGMSDVETTGLALLAFLGAGHTHREGHYKESVRKGLKWLRSQQDSRGCFALETQPRWRTAHAVAGLAMAEAYGMTKSGVWKGSAQSGIDCVQRLQNPDGSWGGPEDDGLILTAWMVMALKSGVYGGLDGEHAVIEKAYQHVKGRESTSPPKPRDAAAAILIRFFAGSEDPTSSPAIQALVGHLMQHLPTWDPAKVDMTYWQFGTLAMFQVGGASWTAWNKSMKKAIVDPLRRDGNFAGSWDPLGPDAKEGGRIWSTALMELCLEVYYRYRRVFGTR